MAPLYEEETITCNSATFDFDYAPKKMLSAEDSCSNSTSPVAAIETKPIHADLCKSDDPFLYYSNDDIRLKALKFEDVSETNCSTKTGDERASRKTRISFELHPDVIFEGMLDGILDDDEDIFGEIDYDGEDGSESDLLAQLLQL